MTHSVDCRMFSRLRLPLWLFLHLGSGPPWMAALSYTHTLWNLFRCSLKAMTVSTVWAKPVLVVTFETFEQSLCDWWRHVQSVRDKQPTRANPHMWIKHLFQKVTVKPWSQLLRCCRCSFSLVSQNKKLLKVKQKYDRFLMLFLIYKCRMWGPIHTFFHSFWKLHFFIHIKYSTNTIWKLPNENTKWCKVMTC